MRQNLSETPSTLNHSAHHGYHSRVREYHMSRQNPDIIDRLYSPSNKDESRNGHIETNTRNNRISSPAASPFSIGHGRPATGGTSSGGTPSQTTLLRQMLNSRKSQSRSPVPGGGSLVQMATRRGAFGKAGRLLRNGGVSPVIVKLAGVKNAEESKVEILNGEDQRPNNPCDKDVVLSALRQRRYGIHYLLWRLCINGCVFL